MNKIDDFRRAKNAKEAAMELNTLRQKVNKIVEEAEVIDIHTHIYSTDFGNLLLWGIDELLNYHYLQVELFRHRPDLSYQTFWRMKKSEQAELIWNTLFLDHTPISEVCRGVITVLNKLGIDVTNRSLDAIRKYLANRNIEEHIDTVFQMARVKYVVMTNNPFDDREHEVWMKGGNIDERFKASVRLDGILNKYSENVPKLQSWGYDVEPSLNDKSKRELRRFLEDWIDRTNSIYLNVTFPPDFHYPEDSLRVRILDECVMPVLAERGLPLAMMMGVVRGANPHLRDGCDFMAKSDVHSVARLVAAYPENKFLATFLSREDTYEACVAARKFKNLMPFGCWWFLNVPSLVTEMTKMRFELLGTSLIPQHSDARVLDQLIYKWNHSKEIIASVLAEKYADIVRAGWNVTEDEIKRDVANLFSDNFEQFIS